MGRLNTDILFLNNIAYCLTFFEFQTWSISSFQKRKPKMFWKSNSAIKSVSLVKMRSLDDIQVNSEVDAFFLSLSPKKTKDSIIYLIIALGIRTGQLYPQSWQQVQIFLTSFKLICLLITCKWIGAPPNTCNGFLALEKLIADYVLRIKSIK